jgi:hypothetical protein
LELLRHSKLAKGGGKRPQRYIWKEDRYGGLLTLKSGIFKAQSENEYALTSDAPEVQLMHLCPGHTTYTNLGQSVSRIYPDCKRSMDLIPERKKKEKKKDICPRGEFNRKHPQLGNFQASPAISDCNTRYDSMKKKTAKVDSD